MPDTEQPEQPELPRRRKRGPKPLAVADKREHCVSVRLNSAELAWLDGARSLVRMQRGEYLRHASISKLPPTIPQINREAWASLARVAGNLNQYQHRLNEGTASGHPPEIIQALTELVQELRAQLLGIKKRDTSTEDDEGEAMNEGED
jgi:hypothetical protein